MDLPPASCYHLEQQDVQLVVAFDCSKPGVHGLGQAELSSRVSGAGSITARLSEGLLMINTDQACQAAVLH